MLKRPLPWIAFALFVLGVPAFATLITRSRAHAQLPAYGQVPAFALTDQTGAPFSSRELDGKVWVADFVFTSCSSACPRLTQAMAELERHLVNRGADARTRLVSISVDPDRDTPERLRAYAAGFSADPQRWKFLTGPAKQIEDAVVGGFKQGLEREAQDAGDSFTIVHGTRLVLVDAHGTIRGFFDAADGAEMARLRAAISRLLDRGGV
jgi:protein SCO1/2